MTSRPGLPPLPLVGRATELAGARTAIERLRLGAGSVLVVTGEGGIGKSRLVGALAEELGRTGWTVAQGRAYAVEAGVPFAVFSDALVPLLSGLPEGALATLARGAEWGVSRLFPALARGPVAAEAADDEGRSRTQMFWSLARVLKGLSARAPVLIVVEDLHWADASSLELLHFVARQTADDPVVIVGTVNDDERARHPTLREVEQSLSALGIAATLELGPLSREATEALIEETFGVGPAVAGGFGRLLRERTGGNPLLIEATLATLIETGRLHREGGSWLGWELSELALPRSVREAILLRLSKLPAAARKAAEAIAVVGGRARHDTVRAAADLDDEELATALDELRAQRIVAEDPVDGWPAYDFVHPLGREVVVTEIGLARRALLHGRVARALEAMYGTRAEEHADELALHFSRSPPDQLARAVPYLAAAGRQALGRFADREAAGYLRLALDRLDADDGDDGGRLELMEDLGRAQRRLGDVDGAVALWSAAAGLAAQAGDRLRESTLLRRIGLARFFAGAHGAALAAYDAAEAAARPDGDARTLGAVLVARGMCLQGIGRVEDAERDLREALALAEASGDPALLARAHRALLLFHTWSGPSDVAREHGRAAIAIAEATGDVALAGSCHWAQAVLEGLTGRAPDFQSHLAAVATINERLGSPLLGLAIAELQVEWAFSSGDWDTALALGERAITLGRSLGQQALLPRLLVWTGLVHLGRDAGERASAYLEEAWTLAGADSPEGHDIHSVVPAHIGIASRHIALGEMAEAVRVAQAGLAIVDRTGYRTWAGHRLLPVLAEAHLIRRDLAGARADGARLRQEAEALDDPLARAWADACDAIALWLGGAPADAADRLRGAAEELEAIPFLPDALRVRRRLAACLADLGDREGAVRELRRIHDGFARLGAERELEKTRRALHDVGARPPARSSASGSGAAALTKREHQIVGLVGAGKSNKAIAKGLGISARTVDTHLSNIFRKLEVASRARLAEVARTLPKPG